MAIEKLRYIVTADTKGFAGPIKAIGALAVTAFVAAIRVTAKFEKELSKLRGVSGATEKQMASLERQSRKLGKSTAFTATEVASAQTELAKLGFTTNEILNSTGGVLDLAAGLGVSLADAATLAGSTMRQFGIESKDITKVVDILSKSTTESALDFTKLQESLKTVAPIANAVGISIESTVGILETLANAGISGSIAGTSLRKAFIDLNAAGIPLADALDRVKNSSDKVGEAVKLVGRRAATAFVILAENGYTAVTDFDGAANDLRETMEDNLIGDFDKLKSAITELGIVVGQANTGWLREFTQYFNEFITNFSDKLDFGNFIAELNEDAFDRINRVAKELRKNLEKVLKPDLSEDAVAFLTELDRADRGLEALGKTADYINGKAFDGLKELFNPLGVDISGTQGNIEKILALSASHRDKFLQSQKESIDLEKKAKKEYEAVTKIIEDELQVVKKKIALAPVQEKSELYILGLKLEENKLQIELNDDTKKQNKLLIDQAVLLAKIKKITSEIAPNTIPSGNEDYFAEINRRESGYYDKIESNPNTAPIVDPNEIDYVDLEHFELFPDDTIEDAIEAGKTKISDGVDEIGDEAGKLGAALQSALNSAFVGIGQAIGEGLANGFKPDDFLKILGQFMQSLGAAIIAVGVAELALKLSAGNPVLAIAAGIALVAAGSYLSASRKENPIGGGGSSGLSKPATDPNQVNSSTQGGGGGEMIIGKVRGQDLLITLQSAQDARLALT